MTSSFTSNCDQFTVFKYNEIQWRLTPNRWTDKQTPSWQTDIFVSDGQVPKQVTIRRNNGQHKYALMMDTYQTDGWTDKFTRINSMSNDNVRVNINVIFSVSFIITGPSFAFKGYIWPNQLIQIFLMLQVDRYLIIVHPNIAKISKPQVHRNIAKQTQAIL